MSEKNILGEIHLPNGKKVPVIGENEKFYLCKDCQFLKSNWELHRVEEKPEKTNKTDKKERKKK